YPGPVAENKLVVAGAAGQVLDRAKRHRAGDAATGNCPDVAGEDVPDVVGRGADQHIATAAAVDGHGRTVWRAIDRHHVRPVTGIEGDTPQLPVRDPAHAGCGDGTGGDFIILVGVAGLVEEVQRVEAGAAIHRNGTAERGEILGRGAEVHPIVAVPEVDRHPAAGERCLDVHGVVATLGIDGDGRNHPRIKLKELAVDLDRVAAVHDVDGHRIVGTGQLVAVNRQRPGVAENQALRRAVVDVVGMVYLGQAGLHQHAVETIGIELGLAVAELVVRRGNGKGGAEVRLGVGHRFGELVRARQGDVIEVGNVFRPSVME